MYRFGSAVLGSCVFLAASLSAQSPAQAQFVCVGNATGALVPPGTADGDGATATGIGAVACGTGTVANGASSSAFGSNNTVTGANSGAFGTGQTVNVLLEDRKSVV